MCGDHQKYLVMYFLWKGEKEKYAARKLGAGGGGGGGVKNDYEKTSKYF